MLFGFVEHVFSSLESENVNLCVFFPSPILMPFLKSENKSRCHSHVVASSVPHHAVLSSLDCTWLLSGVAPFSMFTVEFFGSDLQRKKKRESSAFYFVR